MRDYREKDVNGVIFDIAGKTMLPRDCKVTVRTTSDSRGQTLSLSAFNIMLSIPLESVTDIIQLTERKKTE